MLKSDSIASFSSVNDSNINKSNSKQIALIRFDDNPNQQLLPNYM